MTNAVKISALKHSDRHGAGVFGPVIRSAVGVVRESAGAGFRGCAAAMCSASLRSAP